ncbi:hypothetical protein BD769DRAFT_1681914 [Suillus cothurnatus]|nr:hypothetical protein BD769DRAFT_1681914 [Suillus cothurnatus]
MTAKKSNGGTAPRIKLRLPVDKSRSMPTERMEVCDAFQHNEYCIVCRDGSVEADTLFCCNQCPRVTCLNCMAIPRDLLSMIMDDDVTFVCLCCHLAEQRKDGVQNGPYFGFYKHGRPVLPKFLPILATLEISQRAQISSASVVFVHLKLVDCDTTGSPFLLAHNFYRPYFPQGGIEFCEVEFDVATGAKSAIYQRTAAKHIRELLNQRSWARVVVGITNHTDNETGDPFAGYLEGKYISGEVQDFLQIILNPWQVLLDRAEESYLWLFSCGGMVNNASSFAGLQKSLLSYRITASIAFTAVRFQPSFASHLLLAFVEQVLIERFSISDVFHHMLGQSYKLGRHTDVILMDKGRDAEALTVSKFSWAHADHRPWGQYLPIQCPDCGWIDSWLSATKGGVYAFECTNTRCKKLLTFRQPQGSQKLVPGKTVSSCWLLIPLTFSI